VPELLEVETYRRLADQVVGRTIARVDAPDAWFLKRGLSADALEEALVGTTVGDVRRIGKLMLLDAGTEAGTVTVGLRFGMAGRLLVDGTAAIDRLEYSSDRDLSGWDRVVLHFTDGSDLRLRDPRRLGGVELEPDEGVLGPDAWAISPAQLRDALTGSRQPLKARLLDQHRVAGIGNLLADEMLWRAGLDPARPAGDLTPAELRRLHRHLRRTLDELDERGGSHTGDLQAARVRGAVCPRDGAPLERRTIGGRTTFSCPRHQH
jgi:formamidopyrimidine-DNA glycosylase